WKIRPMRPQHNSPSSAKQRQKYRRIKMIITRNSSINLCFSSDFILCFLIVFLSVSSRVTVTLQPNWSAIYRGETITVKCEIQGGGDTGWTYEWRTTSSNNPPSHSEYTISRVTESHRGDYWCRGRRDYYLTEWSRVMRLTVSSDSRVLPAGGSVTLTCSVNPSSGWKYYWHRENKLSEPLNTHDAVSQTTGKTSVSQEGLYWCRGGRGDPVYYTQFSHSVRIDTIEKPRPVLTVSPSWLSPGASVTLKCEVELPSAGWRFYWYKAVPDGSQRSYRYELLPGSSRGTEQDSYIVRGQTHTAGYVCKAGRGDPVIYTETSELKFVWSGGEFVVSLVFFLSRSKCSVIT
uniref:Ig-like domain-containing protein n=1 Tax=Seriola lalandi dorsalis TaxID=1841481 RepID=A0A3B4WYF4_SERLL